MIIFWTGAVWLSIWLARTFDIGGGMEELLCRTGFYSFCPPEPSSPAYLSPPPHSPPPHSPPPHSPPPPRSLDCEELGFIRERTRRSGHINNQWCYNANIDRTTKFDATNEAMCLSFYLDPAKQPADADAYPYDCSRGCAACVYTFDSTRGSWGCTAAPPMTTCP